MRLELEEGCAGDVLAGGETQKTGQVCATGEAMDVTNLADQSQRVADPGAVDRSEQLGFLAILDQGVAGLEKERFALLEGGDIFGESVHQVADRIPSDGTGEGLAGYIDELLGLGEAEGGTAMGVQGSGQRFGASLDEFIREEVLVGAERRRRDDGVYRPERPGHRGGQ